MQIDTIEVNGINIEQPNMIQHLKNLNEGFETRAKLVDGSFQKLNPSVDYNLQKILDVDDVVGIASLQPTIMDATKEMLYGVEQNGFKTMGLNDLSKWKLDKSSVYYEQNLNQQSGYAAEILSTYKENLKAKATGSELKTYRADDLPELFQKNDQYVDKVRINSDGQIVERIQTKFVGKNGKDWLSKMMSKKFEKYLDGEHVDKLECPKDYYDDVKSAIPDKIADLEKQLERVINEGKTEVAENIQKKIDKLNKIDKMVEQSNTTKTEARYARLHPKSAAAKIFTKETVKLSNKEGMKSGALAAGITFTVSAVDNISSYVNGEITAEEMVKDITTETAAAGVLGYGTAFVSTTVAQTMKASSSQLIQRVGGSCLPAATVSFAVESYDSISEFAKGEISGGELAYDLGENATTIAGSIKGAAIGTSIGAKVGAVAGTVAGPAGTAVGAAVGSVAGAIAGTVVGCVVASEVYATAVEFGVENADKIAEKAQEYANSTIREVKETVPEQLENVRSAFNDFAGSMNLPIHV